MAADGPDSARVQLCLELFGGQAAGAGGFNNADAETFHQVESAGNIAGEMIAQAVELQSERSLEAGFGIRRAGRRSNHGDQDQCRREQQERQEFGLHAGFVIRTAAIGKLKVH